MEKQIKIIENCYSQIKLINSPAYRRIIMFLYENGESNVTNIYLGVNYKQSNTSQMLTNLEEHGIVISEKRGIEVFNRLDHDKLNFLIDICKKVNDYG